MLGQLDQNLIASERKKKEPHAPGTPVETEKPRWRKLAKIAAYIFIAIFAFLFFLLIKFPMDTLIQGQLSQLSQSTPYAWKAEKADFRLFLRPHVILEKLELSPRFGAAQEPIRLDSLSVTPNVFRMIPWKGAVNPSFDFSLESGGGVVNGSASLGADASYEVEGNEINLSRWDFLKRFLPVDLKGVISKLEISLELPQGKLSKSNGDMKISGKGMLLDLASLNTNMSIPPLDLGPLTASLKAVNGRLSIERLLLGDANHDVDVQLSGSVQLRDPVDYSDLDLKIRFKVSDKLRKAVPTIESMLTLLAAKRADGSYGTQIRGPMMAPGMPMPWNE